MRYRTATRRLRCPSRRCARRRLPSRSGTAEPRARPTPPAPGKRGLVPRKCVITPGRVRSHVPHRHDAARAEERERRRTCRTARQARRAAHDIADIVEHSVAQEQRERVSSSLPTGTSSRARRTSYSSTTPAPEPPAAATRFSSTNSSARQHPAPPRVGAQAFERRASRASCMRTAPFAESEARMRPPSGAAARRPRERGDGIARAAGRLATPRERVTFQGVG